MHNRHCIQHYQHKDIFCLSLNFMVVKDVFEVLLHKHILVMIMIECNINSDEYSPYYTDSIDSTATAVTASCTEFDFTGNATTPATAGAQTI